MYNVLHNIMVRSTQSNMRVIRDYAVVSSLGEMYYFVISE
jgi:hypothetical protein